MRLSPFKNLGGLRDPLHNLEMIYQTFVGRCNVELAGLLIIIAGCVVAGGITIVDWVHIYRRQVLMDRLEKVIEGDFRP